MAPISLYGLKVTISPDRPKMVLSEDCPVTPEYREDTNRWMLRFFGTTNLIPDGSVYQTSDGLFMNPRTWDKVKKAATP